MVGFVDRVKERVRSRSRHRKSIGAADVNSSRPGTGNAGHAGHTVGSVNTNRDSASYTDDSSNNRLSPVTKDTSAFHVHAGGNRHSQEVRPSNRHTVHESQLQGQGQGQGLDTYSHSRNVSGHEYPQTEEFPARGSSLANSSPRPKAGYIPNTGNSRRSHEIESDDPSVDLPPRKESLANRRKSLPPSANPNSNPNQAPPYDASNDLSRLSLQEGRPESLAPRRTHESRSRASMDVPAVPPLPTHEQLITRGMNGSSSLRRKEIARKAVNASPAPKDNGIPSGHEHLHLPPGFDLSTTEKTHVTEEWRPAVMSETVMKEQTEVIQEAISRDIHVHHYYTYFQPVKVVEVLPAKHYFLDVKTGEKTLIPEPAGWVMPERMFPVQPDHSMVQGWTRHYMVDEEHPTGIVLPRSEWDK